MDRVRFSDGLTLLKTGQIKNAADDKKNASWVFDGANPKTHLHKYTKTCFCVPDEIQNSKYTFLCICVNAYLCT